MKRMAVKESTILLDVDGVIADLYTPFLRHLKHEHSIDRVLAQWNQYGIRKCLGDVAADAFAVWLEHPNLYEEVPAFSGAFDFVDQLRERGRVIAVSLAYPGHASSKIKWLIGLFGFEWKDIVLTADKTLVDGDLLIEDNQHNIVAYQEEWWASGVLVTQPWNADFDTTTSPKSPPILRVESFNELILAVDKLIKDEWL